MTSTRLLVAIASAVVLAVAGLLAIPAPAATECMGDIGPWPSFRDVAPSAARVVIGKVVGDADPRTVPPGEPLQTALNGKVIWVATDVERPDWTTWFELEVEEVLRGPDRVGDSVIVKHLGPGVALSGPCWRDAVLRVLAGDLIGIAFDGRDAAGHTGVNVATWIVGGAGGECGCVQTDRMSIPQIRRVMGLLPADAIATARGRVWQR